ncbi:MAG: signal peptidase II [Dehalococcoidia bacterium]|nr:signal peptidase II [Dehalococcoidia bacterium]
MQDNGSPSKLVASKTTDFVGEDKSKVSPGKHKSKLRLFLLVTALVVALDQLSKLRIAANQPPTSLEFLPGFINLVFVKNYGVVFGLFSNHKGLHIALSIAGSLIILALLHYHPPTTTLGMSSLALILGGGLGNLIDRIRLGYVIDFINFQLFRWPAFNIADAAIIVGTFTLIYYFCKSGILRKHYEYKRTSGD